MSTIYETRTRLEPEAMVGYHDIRDRFEESFAAFVNAKKRAAVTETLAAEKVIDETLVNDPAFVDAVVQRVPDEAIVEKRYIFLSVSPNATLV